MVTDKLSLVRYCLKTQLKFLYRCFINLPVLYGRHIFPEFSSLLFNPVPLQARIVVSGPMCGVDEPFLASLNFLHWYFHEIIFKLIIIVIFICALPISHIVCCFQIDSVLFPLGKWRSLFLVWYLKVKALTDCLPSCFLPSIYPNGIIFCFCH